MFKQIMQSIIAIAAELLTLFRIFRQKKADEVKIKQKEDFVDRAKKQQEVNVKDADDKLIADTIKAQEEERKKNLEEIRKIISE